MKKVKTSRDLYVQPRTIQALMSSKVPVCRSDSIRRGHFVRGMREIPRIGWESWEGTVASMMLSLEKNRFAKANRYKNAQLRVQALIETVRKRHEELQVLNEEMEANNEELEATNEELQSTTDEMERVSVYRQTVTDNIMDILMTTDTSGIITEVNPATERISGYTKEELVGQPLHKFFTDPDRARDGIKQVLENESVSDYDLEIAARDGNPIPVSYNATVLTDAGGNVIGLLCSARDMTKSKKAAEELQLMSNYNRSLIDASLDSLVTIDASGMISDVNRTTEEVTGLSREELIGTDFSDYFSDPEKARAGYEEAFREGLVRDYALDLQHRDGHTTPVLYNASVFRDDKENIRGVFASARDITVQKQTEQDLLKTIDELKMSQNQLIQASKMSAVGTMTAGIAHELNNPMMGIINFIQYVLKHTDKDDKRYTVLEDAEREVRRASGIVQNLLTFSHMEEKGAEESQKESCDAVINRVVDLIAYRIESQNITLHRHTAEGTPEIWMNSNNIQQVFFNLINNALHAVEETEEKEVSVDVRPGGEFVEIAVTDSGIGIAPENLDKIFDLFYTTKPAGKGLGLGLSTTYSIIQAHGGEIACESKQGKGTTFKVLLPIERRMQKEGKK